jgi:hypothetical protein
VRFRAQQWVRWRTDHRAAIEPDAGPRVGLAASSSKACSPGVAIERDAALYVALKTR